MGSHNSYHYHEGGKKHDHTTSYKDEDELASQGIQTHRITAVKVWWGQYILAIETFYDGVSAGKRQGTDYTDDAHCTEFELGKHENIEKITGCAGDQIDHFTFHTTKGRSQTFGSSTEGSHFTLHEHGNVVKGLTVGFGQNLHFIGAYFGKAYHKPEKSSEVGSIHPYTSQFDDYITHLSHAKDISLKELRVLHDSQQVFGIEGIYEADGVEVTPGVHVGTDLNPNVVNHSIVLDDGKYIREIYGTSGDFIDSLSITLSDGTNFNFGGSTGTPFSNILPGGTKAVIFGGGIGGHLHQFFCYYLNIE